MLEFDRLQRFISEDAFFDPNARFPPPKCYPGTLVEVLKPIIDWIDDPDPRERILWLNGPAGAGKSAITRTIAERLFLTLAWQLVMSIPEIRPYLESTLRTERSIHAKSIDVQFDLGDPGTHRGHKCLKGSHYISLSATGQNLASRKRLIRTS